MEKNCLVTTYKATVNDNSLLKVGEMFIDIIEQESPTNQTNRLCLNTYNTADLVVEVENGGANITLDENMVSGWTNKITLPKSISAPAPVFVRNGNYRLKVLSKYDLTEVGMWTINDKRTAVYVDTKYLKYSRNLNYIYSNIVGDLSNLTGCTKLIKINSIYRQSKLTGSLSDLAPLTAMTEISFQFSNIVGNMSDLAPLTSLTSIDLWGCKKLTGNLSDLAPLTSLTSINLADSQNITGTINDLMQPLTLLNVYNTQVTGELIEFAKTQRSVGRTTGSCEANWWGSKITFNGVVPSSNNLILSWTENTITLGDVTVNQ